MSTLETWPQRTIFLHPRAPDDSTPFTDENKFNEGSFGLENMTQGSQKLDLNNLGSSNKFNYSKRLKGSSPDRTSVNQASPFWESLITDENFGEYMNGGINDRISKFYWDYDKSGRILRSLSWEAITRGGKNLQTTQHWKDSPTKQLQNWFGEAFEFTKNYIIPY